MSMCTLVCVCMDYRCVGARVPGHAYGDLPSRAPGMKFRPLGLNGKPLPLSYLAGPLQ